MTAGHVDDFMLLRWVAADLEIGETGPLQEHVDRCGRCEAALEQVRRLDEELRRLTTGPSSREEAVLPPGDPFRSRPSPPSRGQKRLDPAAAAEATRAAFAGSEQIREDILRARGDARTLETSLAALDLSDPASRFGLLYALQEAGRRIAEGPIAARRFAEQVRRPDG